MRSRRGFRTERHGLLKVAVSAVAVAGFGGGWIAFTTGHDGGVTAAEQPAAGEAPTPVPSSAAATVAATATAARSASTPVASRPTMARRGRAS